MAKIISVNQISTFSKKLQKSGKKIVLAGGCFDILHPGHVVFLEKARQAGDILIILLENDQRVKALKGINRPVHTQKERGKILSALRAIDYVVLLPYLKEGREYDELVGKIKPDVIAAAYGQTNIKHLRRTAKLVGAELKFVTKLVGNHSTSRIVNRSILNR